MWRVLVLLVLNISFAAAGCGCAVWQPNTHYRIGDFVSFGGANSFCTTEHTSDILFDSSKWLADSSETSGCDFALSCQCPGWNQATPYQPGDVISIEGISYRCKAAHVSSSDASPSQSERSTNWEQDSGSSCCSPRQFNNCDNWKSSQQYRVGDYIVYNSQAFVCTAEHISGPSFLASKWSQDPSGTACALSASSLTTDCVEWAPLTRYVVGDTITIKGVPHTCTASHVSSSANSLPSSEKGLYWQQESGKGCVVSRSTTTTFQCQPWSQNTQYRSSDYVVFNSKAYVCNVPHYSGSSFENSKFSEDTTGTACTISPAACTKQCNTWNPSTKYQVGDTCLINASPFVCKLGHVSSISGTAPSDSERGNYWQPDSGSGCCAPTQPTKTRVCDDWQSNTKFHVGDTLTYGNKAFVCKSEHTAGSGFDSSLFYEDGTGTACVLPPSKLCTCSTWQGSRWYNSGDAREYSGHHYTCISTHTASNYWDNGDRRDGGTPDRTYWQEDSGTACCKSCTCNSWAKSIRYHVGDYVSVTTTAGGSQVTTKYACLQEHVSGATFDASLWFKDATSTACCSTGATKSCSCNAWAGSSKYRVGDTVNVGGVPYICKAGHVASNGDTPPTGEVPGLYWDQDSGTGCCNTTTKATCKQWQSNVRYHIGDYVAYKNRAYLCTAEHLSASSFDGSPKWLQDDGDAACATTPSCFGPSNCISWSPSTYYWPGDAVVNGNVPYICKAAHVSNSFSLDLSNWDLDSGAACCNSTAKPTCDQWQASVLYHVGDYVASGGKAYVCAKEHVSGSSFSATNWLQDITKTACSGAPACKGQCPTWQPTTKYRVGDRCASSSGDSYTCKSAHVSSASTNGFSYDQTKYWQKESGSGCCNATTNPPCLPWAQSTHFHPGDHVVYNGKAYLCKSEHVSSSSFSTDKWTEDTSDRLCRPNCVCQPWKSGTKYSVGDVRSYNSGTYRCTTKHTAYSFSWQNWEQDSGKGCCSVSCNCGYYQPDWSSTRIRCPAGKYCPDNSIWPIPCPRGSYCGVGACAPQQCPCGSKCPPHSSAPTPCQPPYYCPSPGATAQTLCPTGYYCPNPGMCTPNKCPAGTWVSCGGKVRCDDCTAGRYCPNVTQTVLCTPGFYCPARSSQPIICPGGSYCTIGASAPKTCPAGYYCPKGASKKTQCQANSYQSNAGQTACLPCTNAKTAGATTCPASPPPPPSKRRLLEEVPVAGAGEEGRRAGQEKLTLWDTAMYSAGTLMVLVASALSVRRVVRYRADKVADEADAIASVDAAAAAAAAAPAVPK